MSTEEFDLARDTFFVNSKPATSAIQKISRSPTKHKKATGGFGTSARKTSKFSVLDPLNFPVQTPGPGTYITHKDWSPRSGKVTDNLEEINLLKYLSQESLSPIISFPRNTEIEDHEPSSKNNGRVTKFSTSNGERGL